MAASPDRRSAARSSSPHAVVEPFQCAHCGVSVVPSTPGTRQRNHCPRCLRSLHVDLTVGDRRNLCRGIMDPIAPWLRGDGELALLHRCRRCGTIRSNRVAGDDDLILLQDGLERLLRSLALQGVER